ncbi:MAG: choline dehydrogenase [Thiotrichales bacterium]|nr:choline dehydrogenase [Thiotrichales bacterium]
MSETFDYIIVGAGSAGCVLANRLSEDPDTRVALIEAGGADRNIYIQVPGGTMDVMNQPDIQWPYQSEPETHLNNRRIWQQRGKVLGGSSSINAMMYMRGNPLDYENWVQLGATGWGFADVLPYFKRSERFDGEPSSLRGGSGPLGVHHNTLDNLLFRVFIEAGVEAGYAHSNDLNGFAQEGFGPADSSVRNGRRSSTAEAYLHPIRSRPNLTVKKLTTARQIIIEQSRAVGVVVEQAGSELSLYAEREVILCAGAINSPQLLMLSGIGPGKHLQSVGIEVKRDIAGVGQNLMDHLVVYLQWQCTRAVSVQPYARPPGRWLAALQWILSKRGPAASTQGEACGFLRSRPGIEWPDIQIDFMPACLLEDLSVAPVPHGFSAHVGPLRPKSRGSIALQSTDPDAAPLIRFNFLTADDDWLGMRASVKLTREVMAQPVFDDYRGSELLPGADVVSDADIDGFVRDTATTNFHATGTCKMGTDEHAVVDPECRVRGIDALRVVDASVMPQITSGNTNGPTIMIAEKAADHIRGMLLPPDPQAFHRAVDWQTSQR